MPWMNEDLRILKRQCTKAERKWKKYKLGASLASLKDLMLTYQRSVKEVRNTYFSELIIKHEHNPRIVNSVISPPRSQPVDQSEERCKEFFKLWRFGSNSTLTSQSQITLTFAHFLHYPTSLITLCQPWNALSHFPNRPPALQTAFPLGF